MAKDMFGRLRGAVSAPAPLNSIGSIASDTTDLERIFTAAGKCSGCSSPIKVFTNGALMRGKCTNEECGKIFRNVVPTAYGMRIIAESVEFKPTRCR